MTRTFLALDFDERFLDVMAATGESLRGRRALSRARWVARHAMHATLRFFGDLDDGQVAALVAATAAITNGLAPSVTVRASALDAFPRPRRARVLVASLAEDPAGTFAALAERAEAHATALGLPPADHAFRAHLTLARLKEPADLCDVIDVARATDEARGAVTAVTLYASELGAGGPRYTALARAPFALT